MSETQEHDDEFTDPVLERTDSTPLWWLRRAFAVAFYESDETVGKGDWMVAYGLGLVLILGSFSSAFVYYAVTQGAQDATAEVAAAASGESMDATAVVDSVLLALTFFGVFLAIAATWKLFHGDSE